MSEQAFTDRAGGARLPEPAGAAAHPDRVRRSWVARTPAIWLTALIGVSVVIRGAIGVRAPSPWILPDEIVYSELAKSMAATGLPSIRGDWVFGWGEVYPTLIAPAWLLFDDPVRAFHAALVINALVMSSAAIPAYLLARLVVAARPAFLVALATVLVPSMVYTDVLMTENAFYPAFLLSVYLIARAVRSPSVTSQALSVVGLVVVSFTRIQGMALVAAYVAAVVIYGITGPPVDRAAYYRRFAPLFAALVAVSLAPPVVATLRGDGPLGWLGARSGLMDGFRPVELPQWIAYLTGDLVLYVAVVPVAATVVMVARGLVRGAPEPTRLFAAVALPAIGAVVVSMGAVSAALNVEGEQTLNDRFVFPVVALSFVGLALWIDQGLPRPRPLAALVVLACCLVALVLPTGELTYIAGFQSVGLVPWGLLPVAGVALGVLQLTFCASFGLLWLRTPAQRAGRLWLWALAWMVFAGWLATLVHTTGARDAAAEASAPSRAWVDRALPAGEPALVVWDQRRAAHGEPDALYRVLMATEMFNDRIGDVLRIGPPTYYEVFLHTKPVTLRPDGTLRGRDGAVVRSDYVLVPCRTGVVGTSVASTADGAWRLVRTTGPLRVTPARCAR